MKETWQERLKRFEATPPDRVWDRLAESLEQDPASVAERLQSWEATPPAGLWDRIEQQLDASQEAVGTEAPVLAMPRRRRTFFAYAAAAALLGAVLIGSALLLNRKQGPSVAQTVPPVPNPAPAEAPPFHSSDNGTGTEEPNSAATTTPGRPAATPSSAPSVDDGVARSARRQPDFGAAGTRDNSYASATPAAAHRPVATPAIDEDRYLVRAYNNGSTVRFSKKVSAVVDCAEHSTGFTQSLCKVSIGAVQERMSSIVSTDFGGLIERLQDLEKTR